MKKSLFGLTLILTFGVLVGCSGEPSDVTTEMRSQAIETSAVETSETAVETITETTYVTAAPTPVPEYIEPLYEEVWYDGFADPFSVRAQIIDDPDDILALVNKYYAIPEGYVPSDLVLAPHSYDQQVRSEVNEAWIKMYDDCLEQTGQGLLLISGWRDLGTQDFLFNRSKNKNGYAFACKKNAIPGRSEHHLGLAIDITNDYKTNIYDDFDKSEAGIWVNEHCHEYGFIIRYKEEYSSETGYGKETWHYRYVGVEVAEYLTENDMSLEAYLGKTQVLPDDE